MICTSKLIFNKYLQHGNMRFRMFWREAIFRYFSLHFYASLYIWYISHQWFCGRYDEISFFNEFYFFLCIIESFICTCWLTVLKNLQISIVMKTKTMFALKTKRHFLDIFLHLDRSRMFLYRLWGNGDSFHGFMVAIYSFNRV